MICLLSAIKLKKRVNFVLKIHVKQPEKINRVELMLSFIY